MSLPTLIQIRNWLRDGNYEAISKLIEELIERRKQTNKALKGF